MNGKDSHLFGVSKTNWMIIYVVILAVGIGSIYYMRLPPRTANSSEADSYFKQARAAIDPEQLRSWALQALAKYPASNQTAVPMEEVPNSIKTFAGKLPAGAYIARSNGRECVVLDWSNPNFDWTIMVGQTNLVMQSSSRITVEPWAAGIYFTCVDH